MKAESAVLKGALESRDKLATKDAAEHLDGKKETGSVIESSGCDRADSPPAEPRNGHAGEVRVSDSRCAAR